jgi:hypothetical protein
MGVESATRIVSFVELTVVDFNDIWHDDQLKKSCESVSAKVIAEGLHDPNELGYFQERGRRKLMDLHGKSIQNRGENRITGKSQLILNCRLGRKASCSQLFGRHGSCSTFCPSHLFDSNISKKQ